MERHDQPQVQTADHWLPPAAVLLTVLGLVAALLVAFAPRAGATSPSTSATSSASRDNLSLPGTAASGSSGDIEGFMTSVLTDVDAYWTRVLKDNGYSEPTVRYAWIPAGQSVVDGCSNQPTDADRRLLLPDRRHDLPVRAVRRGRPRRPACRSGRRATRPTVRSATWPSPTSSPTKRATTSRTSWAGTRAAPRPRASSSTPTAWPGPGPPTPPPAAWSTSRTSTEAKDTAWLVGDYAFDNPEPPRHAGPAPDRLHRRLHRPQFLPSVPLGLTGSGARPRPADARGSGRLGPAGTRQVPFADTPACEGSLPCSTCSSRVDWSSTGPGGRAATATSASATGAVVAIGEVDEAATRTIDATDLVVTPGFVDIHTHYDAQAFWDTTLSPSPLHGVTTVIGGNCGFTIAPLTRRRRRLPHAHARPGRGHAARSRCSSGVPWDWRTTGEYLDRLDGTLHAERRLPGRPLGPAARRDEGRRHRARGHARRAGEQMEAMLREGLRAGGLGFSSTWSTSHNDHPAASVPSRVASREELLALCAVVGEFPGTTLEFIPQVGELRDDSIDLMAEMSRAANRPLNWNFIQVYAQNKEFVDHQLTAGDYAAGHGGRVVALTLPDSFRMRLNFKSGFVLDILPGWDTLMALPARREAGHDAQPRGPGPDGRAGPEPGGLHPLAGELEGLLPRRDVHRRVQALHRAPDRRDRGQSWARRRGTRWPTSSSPTS